MAKDGTNRGGRRVRAGTKPDALSDKITSGREAKVFEPLDFDIDDSFEADDLMDMCDLDGENIPRPSEYLSAEQKDGTHLKADKIFKETWIWLKKRKCESFVNPRLVEDIRRLLQDTSNAKKQSVSLDFWANTRQQVRR